MNRVGNQIARVQALGQDNGSRINSSSPLVTFTTLINGAGPRDGRGTRLILENVRHALSPGHFYVSRATQELFVWPASDWAEPFEAVTPTMFEVVLIDNATDIVFSNLTFTDTSWASLGSVCEADIPAAHPNDGAIRINNSSSIVVEASVFDGLGGYAVVAGNSSHDVSVVGNVITNGGQGAVLLHGNLEPGNKTGVLRMRNSDGAPYANTITHNYIEGSGRILHAGVAIGMMPSSGNYVAHNHILNTADRAIMFNTVAAVGTRESLPIEISWNNTFEFNVINGCCQQLDDCGAIYAYGGGGGNPAYAKLPIPYDLQNTIRFNNISGVTDASTTNDGRHVCRGGKPDPLAPGDQVCLAAGSYALYFDGMDYHGATVFGNIIGPGTSASMLIHGSGINFTNNVLLDGGKSQIIASCYEDPNLPIEGWGSTIEHNIIKFKQYPVNASWGWTGGCVGGCTQEARILDSDCFIPLNYSTVFDPSRLRSMDWNVFFNPDLDLNTATGLFASKWLSFQGSGGPQPEWGAEHNGSLADWRSMRFNASDSPNATHPNDSYPLDTHSVVADPRFTAPALGDYSLHVSSPAWKLGWQQLPPIIVPELRPN